MPAPVRSATATIRGYCYQFDRTILEILRSTDSEKVLVERMEDIDTEGVDEYRATQCKYLPSRKFSLPTIRDALMLMIRGFIETRDLRPNLRFRLFIHCSDGAAAVPASLGLDELKSALTFKRDGKVVSWQEEEGISDEVLEAFAGTLDIVAGPDYAEQQTAAISELRRRIACTEAEADILYYNNALRAVIDLATAKREEDRVTTRAAFLARVATKERLYSQWHRLARGEERVARETRRRIEAGRYLHPQGTNYIFVDRGLRESGGSAGVVRLIQRVVDDRYRMGRVLRNTMPLTFVIEAEVDELRGLKKDLLDQGLRVTDGWESVGFSPYHFDSPPIVNLKQYARGAGEQIVASSYELRVISSETYEQHLADLRQPDNLLMLISSGAPAFLDGTAKRTLTLFPRDLDEAATYLGKK